MALPFEHKLAHDYQAPLRQIIRVLDSEPSPTRSQSILCLQDTFRQLAEQHCAAPSTSTTSSLRSEGHGKLPTFRLPPLQYPSSPYRDLPALYTLADTPSSQQPLPAALPLPRSPSLHCSEPPLDEIPRAQHRQTPEQAPPPATNKTLARLRKRRRTSEASAPGNRPPSPVERIKADPIAITPDCPSQAALQAATSFSRRLNDLTVPERKRHSPAYLHPDDIILLVQFFFDNTFGENCQRRMLSLFAEIGRASTGNVVRTPPKPSYEQHSFPEMQAFFSTYAKWYIEEEKQSQVIPEIAYNIRAFELYEAFSRLRQKASGPQGDALRAFLSTHGFTTSVGRDIRSCILQYLAQELQISGSQLSNTLQAYQGIYLLAQRFGKGILILLPRGASHRMTRIGAPRMQRIIEILFETLPQAVDVCTAAEFLIPYIIDNQDQSLPPLLPPTSLSSIFKISLMETFTSINPT